MFGIDLAMGFFMGLIWWEMIIFIGLFIGFGVSLYNETSAGFMVAFVIFMSISWTGTGSLWTSVTFIGMLYYGIVYLLAGIGWSFYKWRLTVRDAIEYCSNANYYDTREKVKEYIDGKKNYDNFVYWIILWPFSLLGYFLNDFIIDITKKIIDRLYTIYDRITDLMIGKMEFAEVLEDENR